jgi:alpha-ketoglutarate-dependent taurine dioxygenase
MVQFLFSLETQANNLDSKMLLKAWQDYKVVHIRIPNLAPDNVLEYYNRLLPQIGTPYALAEDVKAGDRNQQRTGKIWTEIRYDSSFPNAYRHSANAQPLHTDGSYVSGFPNASLMCCIANTSEGGETVFLNSDILVEILQAENPVLLSDLQKMTVPHARSGDNRNLPVLRQERGVWRVNWNYYCVDPHADAGVLKMRETFQQFLLNSPGIHAALIPIKLQPGDAVIWKDDELLHGRNAFTAHTVSERFLWKCSLDVGVFAGVLV